LSTQYNAFAKQYSEVNSPADSSNSYNRVVFYEYAACIKPGMHVLDVGCGDGLDMLHYQELGVTVFGVDASTEMVKLAKLRLPKADIRCGLFQQTTFGDQAFDAVVSKYALQTTPDLQPAFQEIHRILKPNGLLLCLVVHPIRQLFEKKDERADYFAQQVVVSHIIDDTIQVREPSHTLREYLNPFFLRHFELLAFDERWEPAAEQVGRSKYPGFMIIKARKK
jgi:ubiquinone/menaquinone biosynthesis C-methylase UbiE